MTDRFLAPSDQALLSQTFSVRDPETVAPRLAMPITDAPPKLLFRYDVAPPRNAERAWVWCARCLKPNHWKGYVIECATGDFVTIGHDCGEKHFGFEFGRVENEFNALADRQYELQALLKLRANLPALRLALRGLAQHDAVRAVDAAQSGLKDNWPEVWRGLRARVKVGGSLATERRTRDDRASDATFAEMRANFARRLSLVTNPIRRASIENEREEALDAFEGIFRSSQLDFGLLDGTRFLTFSGGLRNTLEAIEARLGQTALALDARRSSDLDTRAIRSHVRAVQAALEGAEDASLVLDDARRFWTMQNLSAVASWATNRFSDGMRWTAEPRRLRSIAGSVVELNNAAAPAEVGGLEEFRSAMGWNAIRTRTEIDGKMTAITVEAAVERTVEQKAEAQLPIP